MEELLQDHGFIFQASPALFSGTGALAHVSFELKKKDVAHPLLLFRHDREGTALKKAVLSSLRQGGVSIAGELEADSATEGIQEFDTVIALGGGNIQELAKQLSLSKNKVPLFSVLSELQNCREAGPGDAGYFPEAVFLDPRGYQRSDPVLSARSSIIALVLLIESLQRDRVNSLILSYVLTGLEYIEKGAQDLRLLWNRHATANGCVAASIASANAGAGAVSSLAELFEYSGFALSSEAAAALLPSLITQMEELGEPALREAGGRERVISLLEKLTLSAGFEGKRQHILSLIHRFSSLLTQQHAPDIQQFFHFLDQEGT